MKDNLNYTTDVINWYCCIIELRCCAESFSPHGANSMWNDFEFIHHLKLMKDIHASKFVEYVRPYGHKTYIKTKSAAALLDAFLESLYKDYKKAEVYRESRPDLYD